MNPVDFSSHLDKSPPAPVYLFIGEAELLIEEAWKRIHRKLIPEKARHFNGERLSAREHSAGEIIARLSTLPMFGSKQLLMVQNVEAWPKEQQNSLLAYLEKPYPYACLVLSASQKKGLDRIESAVESAGVVVRFSALTEKDAPRWVQERAKDYNKTLTAPAAACLVEMTGTDLHLLDRELEKLCAYVGERERIAPEDVKQVVGSQRVFSVFELLRYVSQHQSNQAIGALHKLLITGEPPLGILALLARQIRLVWQVKDGLERGLPAAQVGQQLKLSSFILKNYSQQALAFSHEELEQAHRNLREADLALKSTGTAPEAILEGLILNLCRSKTKPPRR